MGINIPPQSLLYTQNEWVPNQLFDGRVQSVNGGSATSPAFAYIPANANGIFFPTDGQIGFAATSALRLLLTASSGPILGSTLRYAWSAATPPTTTLDLILERDAANILAQRNGVNAQTLRVYKTFTDASNYERGTFDFATVANTLTIGAEAAGTGTQRGVSIIGSSVVIRASGLDRWNFLTNGSLTTTADNTYDIGASGANRPRNLFLGGALTLGGVGTFLLATTTAAANGAAAQLATITNGPTAGNPTKWIPINDNGTTRYIPAW